MNSTTTHEITAQPTVARGWIAAGFALLAGAAIIVDSSAVTRTAPASSGTLVAMIVVPDRLAVSSDMADWSKAVTSTITPAETVGAYDR